ncbi:SPC22-domain-containing protein [Ramicandelaber brevisporus]|nr:SPC22-domain-containing protein [Ramicandelaber brevisporus]
MSVVMFLLAAISAWSALTRPIVGESTIASLDSSSSNLTWSNGYAQLTANSVNTIFGNVYRNDMLDTRSGYAEFTRINFSIDADLSHLFDWNTKQLFLYLSVEYETPKHGRNQVVIWDKIVKSKEEARELRITESNKYPFRHVDGHFKDTNNAKLVLRWDVAPYVGLMLPETVPFVGEMVKGKSYARAVEAKLRGVESIVLKRKVSTTQA